MDRNAGGGNCTLSSLVMAGLIGALVTVILVIFAGLSWTGSIFMGALAAAATAGLFLFVFCRELTPLSEIQAARAADQVDAAAPASEASAEPAPAVAPAPAAVADAEEAPATSAAAEPEPAPEPAPETGAATDDAAEPTPGEKPATLSAAREGGADNLKEIKGIGPKLEKLCNSMGFFHFDQIANWTDAEVAWMDDNLQGFKGRVTRDQWVAQAKILASGGETEFSQRVDDGKVY